MAWKEIKHDSYTVELEEPTLYVDNKARHRSGHMGHALAEFAPGCIIDFNSNCSAEHWTGHSPYGWMEYRISTDAGKTFWPAIDLPYSKKAFLDGLFSVSVEKAVVCADGSIVAFGVRNIGTMMGGLAEPWSTPTAVRSEDQGKTWSEPFEYAPYEGRTYDAFVYNGTIYTLHFCNPDFLGKKPEHMYRVYKSDDCGKTFSELSVIPFDTERRGYGALLADDDGSFHAFAYNEANECEMDHAVSRDFGETWTVLKPCHLAKGIRNPQIAKLDGVYLLHGRSGGEKGFVLYSGESLDAWDEGLMVVENLLAPAYYSNNLNLRDEKGNFLLVQYSDSYDEQEKARVNVMHMNVRIKR